MNQKPNELYHRGLGDKWKNHKYVMRIEGNRPGKFTYFYSMDEYNRWKNGVKNKVKTGISNAMKTAKASAKKRFVLPAKEAVSRVNQRTKQIADDAAKKAATVKESTKKYMDLIPKTKNQVLKSRDEIVKAAKDSYVSGKKAVLQKANNLNTTAKSTIKNLQKETIDRGKQIATLAKSTASSTAAVADNLLSNTKESFKSAKGSRSQEAKSFVQNLKDIPAKLGDATYDIVNKKRNANTPAITAGGEGHDYLARLDYPDGHTKYIKEKDQWKRYAEIVKYQNNEPRFMNATKEIEPDENGNLPTEEQDRNDVNDKLQQDIENKTPSNRMVNCVFCSTAYELRRRGYDVEAPNLASDINAFNTSVLYDVKDSTMSTKVNKFVIPLGSEYGTDEASAKQMFDQSPFTDVISGQVTKKKDGTLVYVCTTRQKTFDSNDENIRYITPVNDTIKGTRQDGEFGQRVMDSIDKNLKDCPEGSRGMLNVYWSGGGGHSIVWEKDDSGSIKLYDTQVQEEVDPKEFFMDIDAVAPIQLVRTDNLELNPGVLRRITKN